MGDQADFRISDDGRPWFSLRHRSPVLPGLRYRSAEEFIPRGPVTSDLVVTELLEGGDWVAWYRLVAEEGTPVIAELRIFPLEASSTGLETYTPTPTSVPAGGLLSGIARKARPDFIRRLSHAYFEHAGDGRSPEFVEFVDLNMRRAGFDPDRAKLPARTKGGQQLRVSDVHVAAVAAEYANRVRSGSRKPRAETAEHFDQTSEWVRDCLLRARKAGILSPSPGHGRSGGNLTEKGSKLLQQQEEKGPDQT